MEPTPVRVYGRISLHPRGFGFVTTEENDPPHPGAAFVPPPELNPFLAGDLVSAVVQAGPDGRWSASQLSLLERTRTHLFGEVVVRRGKPWLKVDREVANTDWPLVSSEPIPEKSSAVARIDGKQAILERLLPADADNSLERIICRHSLDPVFAPEALADAREARGRSHIKGARRDLRDLPTVTVDAASTRDIDDALSVLPADIDGGMRLFVSIADVAGFVLPGSPLDKAARDRGTSVYMAGQVLSMLPDIISSDWLSILPNEERWALTVEMRIDPEGRLTSTDVYESIIASSARLTYTELAAWLERGELSPALEPVESMLPWLRTVSARLGLARFRRGGIQVSREETRILMDTQTGEPSGLEAIRPTPAHTLIERCMVAANEAVARWLADRGVPCLFRVHERPDASAVQELAEAAHHFGFEAGFGRELTPLSLAAFDTQIMGTPCEPALRSVLLRSLGTARYTSSPLSHFGLASPLYLHFTSPIRRYADLMVHRTIKQYLAGNRSFVNPDPELDRLAAHLNRRGLLAARAETDRRRVLMARLMKKQVGHVFPAHVTRVRSFGLLVQLDSSLAEGLVPLESLPHGPWTPDGRETSLSARGRTLSIGMPLKVKVISADPILGRVEMAWVE